jgi:hypothetical protein
VEALAGYLEHPDPLHGHRSAASRWHGLGRSPQSTRGSLTPRVEGVIVVGVPRSPYRRYSPGCLEEEFCDL